MPAGCHVSYDIILQPYPMTLGWLQNYVIFFGGLVMKIRNNLFFALLGFSILPACLMLITQMLIFTKSDVLAFSDLAFPFIYQLISTYIICFVFFARPIEHFLNSIKRSIKGDYRARFSCSDFNELSRISDAYNQLMSTVEQHTEELKQNRLLQNQLYENEKIYRSALELTDRKSVV